MSEMFCFQCQETIGGKGCVKGGVCGKKPSLAVLQDIQINILKGIAEKIVKGKINVSSIPEINHKVIAGLFMTITNANFDEEIFKSNIEELIKIRDGIEVDGSVILNDAVNYSLKLDGDLSDEYKKIGVLATKNEDIRSLRELTIYGLKGMSAYAYHALNCNKEDISIYEFIYKALSATLDDNLLKDDLIKLVLETGDYSVKVMEVLDNANTSKYGNPEITNVNIGVKNNPAILISGHDLVDLEELLIQTEGKGVDVYTHSEMLPAHYYPELKKYKHLVGNYGNAWWKQLEEFKTFNGPILFTTNCIVPPRDEEIRERIFTTGSSGYPGCKHIDMDSSGKKDFSEIIEMAKSKKSPEEIESGTIVGGFAHNQVIELADKVVEAVKTGAIKKFVVMAGCDGRMKSREYYTEFAKKLPKDTVILTAGCAKYRYNKLNLGDINGIPRVLDAGQCNDSYSLAVIALKLKEVFELDDINDLPIIYNIAWYEQKAVTVLLALLALGVKNIHLGPTLPAVLSENVANILVENFGISGNKTVDEDMDYFFG